MTNRTELKTKRKVQTDNKLNGLQRLEMGFRESKVMRVTDDKLQL